MGKLGEIGLFLMGVSAAVLSLTSLWRDHHDCLMDYCHKSNEGRARFEFDEY